MNIQRIKILILAGICFPLSAHASFIEATIGTAVINDASAVYHNPAALVLLKNPQAVALGTYATYNGSFTGQTIQGGTGFIQSGTAPTHVKYVLPSIYLGAPVTDRLVIGVGVVTNFFSNNSEENTILRYAQSSNSVQDADLVPGFGIQVNDYLSLGGGVSFSRAHMLMQPVTGFPTLDIPDSATRNDTSSVGIGGNAGFVLKPSPSVLVGFNYRNAITYHMRGTSTFQGPPTVNSGTYNFKFWVPARSVLSVNYFMTPRFGIIATAQYIQWSIFRNININNVAAFIGGNPTLVSVSVPFHLNNAWLGTFGVQYWLTQKWIVRVAGTYIESQGNPHYQMANGDNLVVGGSTAYTLSKNFTIDASYAHGFIRNQDINIMGIRNVVTGVNSGDRDSVSLKLTVNV